MSASRSSVEIDSRPSGPTLDLHTDAIILREGAAAVCSSYVRGSSSSLSVTSPTSTPTPTASEPSPFMVRRTAFRAAPAVITVRPSPAMERVRARVLANAQSERHAPAASRERPSHGVERGTAPTWTLFAAFALGGAAVASVEMLFERGVELAALAALVAGVRALAAALAGKRRAQRRQRRSGHARRR